MKSQIAILDFGSQYTHLIARRIRQLGVLATIHSPQVASAAIKNVRGLILSGGPQSVHDSTAIRYNKKILELNKPILGLCYGHQLLAQAYGGQVKPGKVKEYGAASIAVKNSSPLFTGLSRRESVWMSHGDTVVRLPSGFVPIASTSDCPVAAMANDKQKRYGLQFHPEVTRSLNGLKIIENFIFGICGCTKNWSIVAYMAELERQIKKTVGRRKVFLLVSGGVDSTVAFALLERVLGKSRVFGLHIDNGFLRRNESVQVKLALARAGFDDLAVVGASKKFLQAEKGVTDPEKKREIIGRVFLQVKDQVMKKNKLDNAKWMLGQGTIYPDTIETGGTKHADTIKTHHNRVKEVLRLMRLGALIEPLAELYKDEVRQLGKLLGLPASLLERHPFPGPGLAIRTLCATGREVVVDKSTVDAKLKKIVSAPYWATVLPLRSVGVQGDNRTYRHPALLTGPLNWKKIHDLSVAVTNTVAAVNRVAYVAGSVSGGQFKIHPGLLTAERLELLRTVDATVTIFLRRNKLYKKIWQFPVILAPLTVCGGETIILRPVESKEAMTVNFFAMPKRLLTELVKKILAFEGIDAVLYDVTNKPPGTIEWE